MLGLIFTYLLVYGCSAVAFVYPFVGLLAYICHSILRPEVVWFWSVPPGRYSQLIAIGTLAGWAFRKCFTWSFCQARSTTAFAVMYVSWMAITALTAISHETAFADLSIISKTVLMFIVGLTMLSSQRKLQWLAWIIVVSQGYPALELNLIYWRGYNRLYYEGFAYLDNNSYSISLVTCIPLAFSLGLAAKRPWVRAVAFLLAALMTHAVLFSYSRGGLLGLCVAGILILILIPKRIIYLGLSILALGIVLRLAGPQVRERFSTTFASNEDRDASAASRLTLWGNCLTIIKENPIFGIGSGNFPLIVERFGWPRGKFPHTLWLQTAAELGIPGLIFLLGFYLITIFKLFKFRNAIGPPNSWMNLVAGGVIASLGGFMISAQFVSLYRLETPYHLVLLGAGILRQVSINRAA